MTVFKSPTPPDCPVYDVQGDKWAPKLLFWECVSYPSEPKLPFYELLATYGPLSTLEFDVGDKITADQVFDLPMYHPCCCHIDPPCSECLGCRHLDIDDCYEDCQTCEKNEGREAN